MVKPEQKRLYDELLGTKCRCGRVKIARQSFCGRCYKSLPAAMQRAMYRLIGNGYEEAYAAAVKWLDRDRDEEDDATFPGGLQGAGQ